MGRGETPMERFKIAMDLFEAGEDLMRQNLRRKYPDATPEEIEERLGEWLEERPGAEGGDAPGKVTWWPTRR